MKKIILFLCVLSLSLFAKEVQEIIATNCSTCHGTQMEKECFGVSKIPNTFDSDTLYKVLNEYKEGKRNQYSMGGVMTARVKDLSDDDIKALSIYVHKLGKK
ncbi:c-type cytochrome [Arcobacter sp. LA11]|uniref:c-type cytochrome n=1 Tax=Arcobacter sp. LA11 TaxID=1898176 RepID=UPI000933411F|nr:c-type cytochrome [Arcobacter sp. LA11]